MDNNKTNQTQQPGSGEQKRVSLLKKILRKAKPMTFRIVLPGALVLGLAMAVWLAFMARTYQTLRSVSAR